MSLPWLIGICYLAIWAYMTLGWLVSLVREDASVVDIFWGLGFVGLAWLVFSFSEGYSARKYIVCAMTTLWGVRLAAYIAVRNWGRGEDYRYQEMRDSAGPRFRWTSYVKVFLLQGVLMGTVAAPVLAGQSHVSPAYLTPFDIAGISVWAVGFLFESVGDLQLYRFKRDPSNKGKIMREGLWAYTRHPNYFGESLVWWGLFLVALGTPYGYWSIVGPITITALLLRVSGVTLLEKGMTGRPGYDDYVKTTSAFLPLPPKRSR